MFLRNFSTFLVLGLVIFSTGCGGGGGASVSGSVSFNGQPLDKGQISFVPSDGKGSPVSGTISGGKFSVAKVPVGKCKVVISSMLAGPAPSSMGDATKEKKKDGPVEVLPTDEGNSKEQDIPAGGTTLEIAVRTAASSAPPKK